MNQKKNVTRVSHGKMSNIVGMYAMIIDDDEKIRQFMYIKGKADDSHFIVQCISPLDGSPNVSKLCTIEQMKKWYFLDADTVEYIYNDYDRHDRFRFKFSL